MARHVHEVEGKDVGEIQYISLSAIGVDLSGTDGTHKRGSEFKFQSASDSNINVSIDNNGVIVVGCYYI